MTARPSLGGTHRHWPPVITASVPVDTLPISVTGAHCGRDCAHCGSHYLRGMRPLEGAAPWGRPSLLISGGCNACGRVPVREHRDELLPHIQGRRTNWHLGVVEGEDLEALDGLLDVVSFDFVGDDETLQEVYGPGTTVADLERCLETLMPRARVVPHVTVGLRGGRLGHEWPALERLGRFEFDSLVFLVLIPTAGTRYEAVQPPDQRRWRRYWRRRGCASDVSLQLGCAWPKGAYREQLDPLAVRAGANVIVNPVRAAVTLARSWG